ncbi:hypothetical protein [Lysinibacillus sp. NPDC086135]|uniref:hypothetical protein n=1 Tax=Lysinibacillus sp. NPDC086135 TaxID=3364130 RepID=UPI00380CF761
MQRNQLKQRILRESSEFISYLKELICENRFDDGEVIEISLLVIKNGPESLSEKQWYVF